jgi:hypothetical protein
MRTFAYFSAKIRILFKYTKKSTKFPRFLHFYENLPRFRLVQRGAHALDDLEGEAVLWLAIQHGGSAVVFRKE